MVLDTTGFLTQEEEPSGTTLVDSHNGFNDLSLLEILWIVQHFRTAGERYVLN